MIFAHTNTMFGLTKHCPVCGMDVEKEIGIKRFGKFFCSEEHAQDYTKLRMVREERGEDDSRTRRSSGGCCG